MVIHQRELFEGGMTAPIIEEEQIREKNLCEERHQDVSSFIQQLERHLDGLQSEIRGLEEEDT